METYAHQVKGVDKVELRLYKGASLYKEGQLIKEAGLGIYLEGIPTNSDFYEPLIIGGRWFIPGDGKAIVISRNMASKNEIRVGDKVKLDLGTSGEDYWQVIGLYEPVFISNFNTEIIYTPLESLYQATKWFNRGSYLYVRTVRAQSQCGKEHQ